MPSIYEQAVEFRRQLIARDSAAIEFLTNEYRLVYARLLRALADLTNQIEVAQGSGEAVSRAWLNRQWQYQSLLRQMDDEFRQYGVMLAQAVAARQAFESQQGAADASAMIGGQFDRLPVRALQNIISNLQQSSPLGQLLAKFGPVASERVAETLRDAIALGKNPRAVAPQVRDALGVPLSRALLIARTESVRAYRQASLSSFQDAGVEQWRWVASKSPRTCLNCLARDGEIYSIKKPFPAHPNCRCTMVPIIEGRQPRAETAAEWFRRLPDETKRTMMSGAAFDLYKQGKIKLADFKGEKKSRKWGEVTYQRSVKEILGE